MTPKSVQTLQSNVSSRRTLTLPEAVYHAVYQRRRDHWIQEASRVESVTPIISVGNLSTGGTGKTPAVQWLVRRLQARGLHVAVVARGYGGSHSARGAIVSDGKHIFLGAHAAGDEPLLHAKGLPGAPVIIGRDRVEAVQTAAQRFQPDAIVLDDGFQYWSLPRAFDWVLLDARAPFGNGKLLPLGHLREPPAQLSRADGILLTRSERATEEQLHRTLENVRRWSQAPVWTASHAPVAVHDESSGATLPLKALSGARVAAISALADNGSFLNTLKSCGAKVGARLARSDHHRWREREVREFSIRCEKETGDGTLTGSRVQAIVTTEKDAVKLQSNWSPSLPLWSLVIELRVEDEESLMRTVMQKLPSGVGIDDEDERNGMSGEQTSAMESA